MRVADAADISAACSLIVALMTGSLVGDRPWRPRIAVRGAQPFAFRVDGLDWTA
jgi:hypothetical protein